MSSDDAGTSLVRSALFLESVTLPNGFSPTSTALTVIKAPGISFVLLMSCLLTEIFVISSFIVTEVPSLKFSPVVVIFPFSIVNSIFSATVYPSGAVVSVSV